MDKQIPNKLFFKIGEVCEITDTQPYVLRYWESEFRWMAPQKSRSKQRLYRQRDVDIILLIKPRRSVVFRPSKLFGALSE